MSVENTASRTAPEGSFAPDCGHELDDVLGGSCADARPALLICILAVLLTLHFVRRRHRRTSSWEAAAGSRFHQVRSDTKKFSPKTDHARHSRDEGSLDNFDRLTAANPRWTSRWWRPARRIADPGNVVSLGSMFYVPLIVFYRNPRDAAPLAAAGPARGDRTRRKRHPMLALALLKATR